MRRLLVLGALFAFGCRPPVGKQEEHFKDLLLLHFNNLNNEAEVAKMDAKAPRKTTDAPSIGRQFSTYQFWHNGVILQDIECPGCKTKHLVVTYRGEQEEVVISETLSLLDSKASVGRQLSCIAERLKQRRWKRALGIDG